jgi:hypothetical protein
MQDNKNATVPKKLETLNMHSPIINKIAKTSRQ